MTARERIMNVLKGQAPDRIPWTPLIDGYYLSGLQMPLDQYDAIRAFGGDIFARHIDIYREVLLTDVVVAEDGSRTITQKCPKGLFFNTITDDGIVVTETTETPLGILHGRWVRNEHSPYMPFPVEYRLKTVEDIKILKYVCANTDFEPDFDVLAKAEAAIGPDGIATVTAPGTPFHDLLEGDFGIEKCYFMLYDHEREMEDLMEVMHEQRKKAYLIVARSPAEVVIGYENTSTTTMSPDIYERYCENQINEYADIMHGAGKIFLNHMCGKLSGLTKQLARGRMDGIVDIAPLPTGDMTLSEAKRAFGPDKIVMGGIDATTYRNLSPDQMAAYIKSVLADIAPGDRVLLGSGDATPIGTPLANLKAVTEVVKKYGQYPICFKP